jgi:hypothetical protein
MQRVGLKRGLHSGTRQLSRQPRRPPAPSTTRYTTPGRILRMNQAILRLQRHLHRIQSMSRPTSRGTGRADRRAISERHAPVICFPIVACQSAEPRQHLNLRGHRADIGRLNMALVYRQSMISEAAAAVCVCALYFIFLPPMLALASSVQLTGFMFAWTIDTRLRGKLPLLAVLSPVLVVLSPVLVVLARALVRMFT